MSMNFSLFYKKNYKNLSKQNLTALRGWNQLKIHLYYVKYGKNLFSKSENLPNNTFTKTENRD